MNRMKSKFFSVFFVASLFAVLSCDDEGTLNVPEIVYTPSTDPLDEYIRTNFTEEYGIAVRYKYVDRYVDQNKRVTPPKLEVVVPMLDFLEEFWIEPFVDVPNGEAFFRDHVPAEVIFIGSTM